MCIRNEKGIKNETSGVSILKCGIFCALVSMQEKKLYSDTTRSTFTDCETSDINKQWTAGIELIFDKNRVMCEHSHTIKSFCGWTFLG